MTAGRNRPPLLRTVLRGGAVAIALQLLLLAVARLTARRLDEGDESTAEIRRALVLAGVELRPANPVLSRVRVDAVMGGGLLDLTGLAPVPGGTDVTVWALMGGLRLQVPAGSRVWWEFRGALGGVAAVGDVERVSDPTTADVRVHATAVLGGVSCEAPER